MKIGKVELENNVFLAPMAGITDMAFRIICKEMGSGLTYTEMVSSKGMFFGSIRTKDLLIFAKEEKPRAAQIFGNDPGIMAKMAEEVEALGAEIIDINMGCPASKIVKNGDGSALMRDPEKAEAIVNKVTSAVKVPITVKFRKGWDNESINGIDFAKRMEQSGAAALTIHGRTRDQFYSGKADWNIIRDIKEAVRVPVIGNGDIFSPEDAKKMLEETGCDGVMIGRGAEGNPWIFKRTIEYLKSGILLPLPTNRERLEMLIRQLKMVVELKGEDIGVMEMRKQGAWYLKGLPGGAIVKTKLQTLKKMEEVIELLRVYEEKLVCEGLYD